MKHCTCTSNSQTRPTLTVFIVVVGVAVVDDDGVGGVGGVDLKKSWMIVMRFDCYCFYICYPESRRLF